MQVTAGGRTTSMYFDWTGIYRYGPWRRISPKKKMTMTIDAHGVFAIAFPILS